MLLWWLLPLVLSVSGKHPSGSGVCSSVDIRNKPAKLESLRGCRVVEGYVRIVLMERGNETDFLRHALPELREITEYLLLYRVVGLRSVAHIMPNLAVIRGQSLFEDYALVVYEMFNLQEIGLSKLTDIVRGAVRVEKNARLCYVKTVEWDRIARWDPLKNYITKNKDPASCPRCQGSCPQGLCWSRSTCQIQPQVAECHPLCAGGCSGPTDSDCVTCRKYVTPSKQCVHHCPVGTYEYLGWRCVSKTECMSLKPPDVRSPLVMFNGTCTASCPDGLERSVNGCVPCRDGHCHKVCFGRAVDTVASAQSLRSCTFINGSLEISIKNGKPRIVAQELEESLGAIREIKGCLKIVRSPPLINLNFLKNLTVIHADSSDKCAMVVMENQNLQELWDWDTKKEFKILKNRLNFHYNPKLCLNHILKLIEIIHLENVTDIEVAKKSNGDKFPCNADKINISVVYKTYNKIQIHIPLLELDKSQYSFLRLEIHYIKDPGRNISRYDDVDQCSDYGWKTKDVYVDLHENVTIQGLNVTVSELEPNTQYAYYITTYSVDSIVATSHTQYESTLPSTPSELGYVQACAPSSKEIVVTWLPPKQVNGELQEFVVTWTLLEQDESLVSLRDYCENPMSYSVDSVTHKPDLWEKTLNKTCCEEEPSVPPKDGFENLCSNFEQYTFPEGFPEVSSSHTCESYFNNYICHSDLSKKTDKKEVDVKRTIKKTKFRTKEKVELVSLQPTMRNFTILNVKHFQDYMVTVRACRKEHPEEVNCSEDTRCSKTDIIFVRTQKDEKADVISNGIHHEVLNRTLLVSWDTPVQPNGITVAFELEYRQRDEITPKSVTYCIPYLEYKLNKKSYTVLDLLPGEYEFRIRSISLAGIGNFTEFITFKVTRDLTLSDVMVFTFPFVSVVVIMILIVLLMKFLRKETDLAILHAMVNTDYYCPKDKWELNRDDLVLVREVGCGTFGKVYEGLLKPNNIPCAVKAIGENFNVCNRTLFLNEASIMKSVSGAYHIVQLLGVVSREKPPLVVMELMNLGDLRTYLMSVRDINPPSEQVLLRMAAQIADGMCFMEAKKFVHRDLAARNCLIDSNLTVKVGDFGMTRDIYETDYYRKGDKGLLPIRWMSPESLKDGLFTSQSDVWSYGIVLWEIVTMGCQPYHGHRNEVVLREVMAGQLRLDVPTQCPVALSTLMQSCWRTRPSQRIPFMHAVGSLEYYVTEQFKEVSFFHSEEAVQIRKDLSDYELWSVDDPLLGEEDKTAADRKIALVLPKHRRPTKFNLKLKTVLEEADSSADDTI